MDFINKSENLLAVRKISKYTTLTVHIQLLLGIVFLFLNPSILENLSNKISVTSVSYIEHVASNIIAIILITVFGVKLKKVNQINKGLLVLLIIAIILLSRVVPLIVNLLK